MKEGESHGALSGWIAANYDLARPVECGLLRSYTNDVYYVTCPDGKFVLKVYGKGWRTGPEINYEIALLRHLIARGFPTPKPVADKDGDYLKRWKADNGNRYALLFEYAPGQKPQPPLAPQSYAELGKTIAQMHLLTDDFVSSAHRRALDLDYLIDEPLAAALPLLESAEDRVFLRALAERAKERIAALASVGLDWGPIHGDATFDNLHVIADGGIVLYDFDSGGPGWRAADMQGWAAGQDEHREKWEAFTAGYGSVRPLQETDLLAAPLLTIAWDIWGLKIDLDNRLLRRGEAEVQQYLRGRMALLRERNRTLLKGADRVTDV